MGTQPFPEIQAAQYDSALLISLYPVFAQGKHLRRYIIPYTLFCDLSRDFGVGKLFVGNGDILSPDMVLTDQPLDVSPKRSDATYLVRALHVLIKDVHRDLDQSGMSDPSTIMTRGHFPLFVRSDFGHGCIVLCGVILDWDLGRHSSHCCYLSPRD